MRLLHNLGCKFAPFALLCSFLFVPSQLMGAESAPPELISISVDKVSVDVTDGPQTVTFAVVAEDESGIDWEAGAFATAIHLVGPSGGVKIVQKPETPGRFEVQFTSDDPEGVWTFTLYLTDTVGNFTSFRGQSLLDAGIENEELYLFDETTAVSNLTAALSGITTVFDGSSSTEYLTITNSGETVEDQVQLSLKAGNLRIDGVALAGPGALSCSISNVNFNGNGSCTLSSINQGTSATLAISVTAGSGVNSTLTGKVLGSLPEATFADNTFSASYGVDVDTDLDGIGNETDLDDDGDGIEDGEDVFPLDAEETKDSDGDGVGDNTDPDDDNDGVLDESDGFPLISLGGRKDSDQDGYPDECDELCIAGGLLADMDDDNDGISDIDDNCPNAVNDNQLDTDDDSQGDACDLDDDNDGFTDEEELTDGTNPLSPFSCRSGCFSFDIDENKEAKALTDGLLVIRHLFGFSGDSLTSGATTAEGARTSAEAISSYLGDADSELDIDGDGQSKALTDGLLLIRYLFGFSGDSLTAGAIGEGAERGTAGDIEKYISDRLPSE